MERVKKINHNDIKTWVFSCQVILGLRETEERYYLLVKEPMKFREASMNCKLRGGALAMPKTVNTNRLMADYVRQAGLTHVYIGVQAQNKDTVRDPQQHSEYLHNDTDGKKASLPPLCHISVLSKAIWTNSTETCWTELV